jgi:hypothetical protein
MAKILNGILGGGRGKVAGVVMGIWKGISYLKAYAVPSNPNTVPQQTQRTKFGEFSTIMSQFNIAFISQYFASILPKQSGFNAFFQKNYEFYGASDTLDSWIGSFKMPRVDAGAGNKPVVTSVAATTLTLNGTSSEIVIGDRLLVVILAADATYVDDAVLRVATAVASSANQNLAPTYTTLASGDYVYLAFKLRGNLYSEVTVANFSI